MDAIVPNGRFLTICAAQSSCDHSECAVQSSYEHSECYQMVFVLCSKTRWNQECHKRWFQWRYVNRLTLHFTRKAEIVTNGLLKMCPRLEPQQHFEAACCSGKASLVVARVSCMSVCNMCPRLQVKRFRQPSGMSRMA